MNKADELLQLVREDSSLENIKETVVNHQIDITRHNSYCKQLTLLARNSVSAVKSIIDTINDLALDNSNDFRIFSLLLTLSDAGTDAAIDLSRKFAQRDDLSKSRTIAINILLRESMYGRSR